MNSRNLCVIFLGGIFLSLPSELFFLPLMQTNSSLYGNSTAEFQNLEGNVTAVSPGLEESTTAVNQNSTSIWKLMSIRTQKHREASQSTSMPTEVTIAWSGRRVTYAKSDDIYLETIPRIPVASNPDKLYEPDTELSTVCMGSPIPYLDHKVMGWLYRNSYKREHKARRIYFTLRREIFEDGKSEMCHDLKKFGKWMEYQECALRRNQRLEAYIPKYPLHQIVKG